VHTLYHVFFIIIIIIIIIIYLLNIISISITQLKVLQSQKHTRFIKRRTIRIILRDITTTVKRDITQRVFCATDMEMQVNLGTRLTPFLTACWSTNSHYINVSWSASVFNFVVEVKMFTMFSVQCSAHELRGQKALMLHFVHNDGDSIGQIWITSFSLQAPRALFHK
jgi:hypothetical protein